MPQNLDSKLQIEDLRESGISFFQRKVRFGVKTSIWALVWNGPKQHVDGPGNVRWGLIGVEGQGRNQQ